MFASFSEARASLDESLLKLSTKILVAAMREEQQWVRDSATAFIHESTVDTVEDLLARGEVLLGPPGARLQLRKAFLTALGKVSGMLIRPEPSPSSQLEFGPADGPVLTDWARQHDVERCLAHPALPYLAGPARNIFASFFRFRTQALVREVLLATESHAPTQLARLKAALIESLLVVGARVSRGRAYELATPEPSSPIEDRAAAILGPLRALRASLRSRTEPFAPHDVPRPIKIRYALSGRSPAVTFDAGEGDDRWKVKIPLELHQDLGAACAIHMGPCDHKLAAVDEILRTLTASPPPKELEALIALSDVPGWMRVIQELETIARGAPDAQESEVTWWIASSGYAVSIAAVRRKRGKKGEWLTPKTVRAATLLNSPLEDIDRRPAELLAMGERTYHSDIVPSVIEALVGHPRVIAGPMLGAAVKYSVEQHSARVALRREDDEIRVMLTAAGKDCRTARDRDLIVDEDAKRIVVARIDKTVLATFERVSEALRRLPPADLPAFAAHLAVVDPKVPIDAVDLVPVEEMVARDDWVLKVAARDDGVIEARLEVRPLAGGPCYLAGTPPARALAPVGRDRLLAASRDLLAEQAGVSARWVAWGLEKTEDPRQIIAGDAALRMIAGVRADPRGTTVEWTSRAIKVLPTVRSRALKLGLTSGPDWFGVEGEVVLDEHRATLAMLLDAARNKSDFVAIGDGTYLELEQVLVERLRALEPHVRRVKNRLEVGSLSVPALAAVLGDATPPPRWVDIAARAREAGEIAPEIPSGLDAVLRPYQIEAYVWMSRLAAWGAGCLLADDMGLGKTVETIAVLLARSGLGPALVVAPTSVTHNWRRELSRFAPALEVVSLRDADLDHLGPGQIVVTSYGLMVADVERIAKKRFATLVLDEAQVIKNPASQRSKAARSLTADWRVALTGTPVENHLGDLWALLAAVSPGLLGSWDQFRDRWMGVPSSGLDGLRKVVRPFILRRTKAEVLAELPPKTEVVVDVELSAAERTIYEDARQASKAALQGLGAQLGTAAGRFHVLAAMTRLRQLACDVSMVIPDEPPPSSKLARFVDLASGLVEEGHSAVAFSQFTKLLDRAEAALMAAGIAYSRLDGSTPADARGDLVDAFQAGGPSIMLVSLKAGGTGLNLTAAHHVFHLDPWWNPAVEDQATDRTHRIGQTKPVTVFRMVSRGTIESAILSMHASKRDLAAQILEGTGGGGALSAEALLAMITDDTPPAPPPEPPPPARSAPSRIPRRDGRGSA